MFKLVHANSKRFPKVTVRSCEPPKQIAAACCGPDDSFEVIEEVTEREREKPLFEKIVLEAVSDNSRVMAGRLRQLLLKEEEELIHDLVGSNLAMLGRRAQVAVLKMEHEMTEDIVRLNSQSMSLRIANKLVAEEEEMIQDLAKQAVERITLSSVEKYMAMVEDSPRPAYRPYRSKSSENRQNSDIEKLVDRKVRQLLPTIIERVTAAV